MNGEQKGETFASRRPQTTVGNGVDVEILSPGRHHIRNTPASIRYAEGKSLLTTSIPNGTFLNDGKRIRLPADELKDNETSSASVDHPEIQNACDRHGQQ